MSKKKTEDYVIEVSDVFESSGDFLDDIIEALNDRGIQAYVYKKVITPEIFTYANIEFHHPKWGFLDVGSRVSYFGLEDNQFYIRPEPRFNYRYRITPQLWLKAAASQNVQFFHQLNKLIGSCFIHTSINEFLFCTT